MDSLSNIFKCAGNGRVPISQHMVSQSRSYWTPHTLLWAELPRSWCTGKLCIDLNAEFSLVWSIPQSLDIDGFIKYYTSTSVCIFVSSFNNVRLHIIMALPRPRIRLFFQLPEITPFKTFLCPQSRRRCFQRKWVMSLIIRITSSRTRANRVLQICHQHISTIRVAIIALVKSTFINWHFQHGPLSQAVLFINQRYLKHPSMKIFKDK